MLSARYNPTLSKTRLYVPRHTCVPSACEIVRMSYVVSRYFNAWAKLCNMNYDVKTFVNMNSE
jgi:hypothetical protein